MGTGSTRLKQKRSARDGIHTRMSHARAEISITAIHFVRRQYLNAAAASTLYVILRSTLVLSSPAFFLVLRAHSAFSTTRLHIHLQSPHQKRR
jgi:hypothetical protein